ncbi:MAG: Hsp33 family molecular chaperone HslO [Kiloniellales bacterium]|nr:Hsp33 family molecular chaperone HslO [Kiloniellales bacterium]
MPEGDLSAGTLRDDFVRPFLLEIPGLRGRLVRLGALVDLILGRHDYPEPVAALLGELVALSAALSSTLKFDGIFTLQTKGDGPVRMMVADVTSGGELRAYAEVDADKLAEVWEEGAAARPSATALLGQGYLAFTVDQGDNSERYQGIVELEGDSLAEIVQHYFRQSEQFNAAIRLAAGRAEGAWRAGALILQQLPEEGEEWLGSGEEDDWRRNVVLMSSCRDHELLDPALSADQLLYRLFHEERVRVYEARLLHEGCRCSRERIESVLRSLPDEDLEYMKVDGELVVTCQFCNIDYRFSEQSIDDIRAR